MVGGPLPFGLNGNVGSLVLLFSATCQKCDCAECYYDGFSQVILLVLIRRRARIPLPSSGGGWLIIETVPFTLAHAAAAWPLRRTRLILPAVVVGTFAPDFIYFVRLSPGVHFGHTLPGVFALDLPLSLAVLWLFYATMREPMVAFLPEQIQRRIRPCPRMFRFWGPARLALIIGSILAGAGTHILWDSFTHTTFWPYRHWRLLSETVGLPIVGTVEYYKLFQYGSTVAGSAVLGIWFLHWYRTTIPDQRLPARPFSPGTKRVLLGLLTFIALSGALIRAIVGVGMPKSLQTAEGFLIDAVITVVTLLWLQLLIFGIVWTRQRKP
jgi:Domain of unknown function (DUF4184)